MISDFRSFYNSHFSSNSPGLLASQHIGHRTFTIWNWKSGESIGDLKDFNHFGFVFNDTVVLTSHTGDFLLSPGMSFSTLGLISLAGSGNVFGVSVNKFQSLFQLVGPIFPEGLLSYIDGCTDSLLIPPPRLGDPCLNHLHFPPGTNQTQHTHPSFRAGLVFSGRGQAHLDNKIKDISQGEVFLLPSGELHSFQTYESSMDIIAFHPDSDFGPTDTNHPMINRTIIDGQPASYIKDILT